MNWIIIELSLFCDKGLPDCLRNLLQYCFALPRDLFPHKLLLILFRLRIIWKIIMVEN